MAKKRKGAKRGSSASRSRPSKAKQPHKKSAEPVSPAPRKRAPAKKRDRVATSVKEARSRAARRGWETRRKENPLRWGREAVAKRRINSRVVESSASAVEHEWREIEKKALHQQKEAERAGGIHPSIAGKLATLERIEGQIAAMKANIRTFNSPSPDPWELKAYTLLEKFITLRDFGGTHEEIAEAHRQWYAAKQDAREKSPDWPAWMAMIGSVLGLPMHGTFSVDSFVTS